MSGSDPTPALFAHLPDGLFGPLASPNRLHYWSILGRLYAEYFGPDAPLPPSDGYPRRELTAAIERWLLSDDPWEDDEGESPDTPLTVRANAIYERLRAAGWLRQERVGVREMASMTQPVSLLLGTLWDFAERGPAFLGAKIRSVELLLRQVVEHDAGGDALDEAADQTRGLLSHVAAISVRVRDLMPELIKAGSTAQFARQLFERYVTELFIGDYAQLHNADHPLARRTAVLALVRDIEQSEHRDRLLHWYQERTPGHDAERAAGRLERSLRRLRELDRIAEYLERLDEDIRQANRRALAFLDYRLRAPDRFDVLLQRACRGALAAPEHELRLPVAPGPLLDETRLRAPRNRSRPIPRTANVTTPPTPEQLARMHLLRQMKRVRQVLPEDLSRYVDRHLGGRERVSSDELAIDSIADLRAYQVLSTLALRGHRNGGLRRDDPLRRMLRGFDVELDARARTANHHLDTPRFTLRRTRHAA